MTLLQSLRKKAEAATPGPWKMDRAGDVVTRVPVNRERDTHRVIAGSYSLYPHENDAAYIAACSPDVILKLIEAVEVMRDALDFVGHDCMHSESNCPTREHMRVKAKEALARVAELLGEKG